MYFADALGMMSYFVEIALYEDLPIVLCHRGEWLMRMKSEQ